ncbi:Ribonuclease P protein subunit p29 [Morella rubra]|uniref:Ribonuclease P protein subunit p29 n=1 Tax=Morella rubra TaxID=262757 RepID=A0A6A1WHJ4_9ROSI|nr:Ribonuclease P protein subunit p29 [Morella rubra]
MVDKILHELLQHGDVAQKYMQGSRNIKVDNWVLLDNFVQGRGVSTGSQIRALRVHSRRSKRHMSMKQLKKCGAFDLPKQLHKFDVFRPMHEMWKGYMMQLVKNIGKNQLAQCLLNADLHGAVILVAECKVTSFTGVGGIMIRETTETFGIITEDDTFRGNSSTRFNFQEFHVRISEKGDLLFSEWSSQSVNEIHMGKYGAVWMVNMSDKLLVASTAVDFASKFTESRRGFLAQRCCNKGGRYIAVVEYGGRRKLGAVLVPEGKHGHGWQILNRVFLEAVSCFRSASLSVTRVESSRIRPEDSFAKNPEVGPIPKLISSSMSKEHAEEGKCPAGLSDREALSLNGVDLGKQVMSLRKEVDRLASLLRQQCQGGFSFPALSCSVCGFTLKAQKARAHPPCQFFGREFGLPCGGPNFGARDLGVSLGKVLGRAEEDLEMACDGPGGVDGITVAHGGKGGCSNSSGAHAEVALELSVVVGSITSGSPALECAVGGQLLESKCVSLLHISSSLQPASVGDLPTASPAPELAFWWSVAGAGGHASFDAEGSRC